MTNLKNITNHYQSVIGGELEKIHCEEWKMDIYFRKTYSFKDESRIVEYSTKGLIVDALVESIIVKARDKDGKKLFNDGDRSTLMNEADPSVIIKVAGAINNANLTKSLSKDIIAKE
jgi:hypothetical protein